MTEKEAMLVLKDFDNQVSVKADGAYQSTIGKMACDAAISALEEVQKYRALGTVEELSKRVKEEDVLKFYYCESEDKYLIGRRCDALYYAEVDKSGITFNMSRYLPWGEHVVAPNTLWKEHTYPSEPKEMAFFDWLMGFIKKECGGTLEELREAREKQVPKEPIPHICIWNCPKCGGMDLEELSEFGNTVKEYAYCPDCGQAIDWNDENEQ